MKTILLSIGIFFSTIISKGPGEVYICNNHKTDKYHLSPACKGLRNCQFKIVKISAQTAKTKKMSLCAWEGKKSK